MSAMALFFTLGQDEAAKKGEKQRGQDVRQQCSMSIHMGRDRSRPFSS
jgi:hypothetical protein